MTRLVILSSIAVILMGCGRTAPNILKPVDVSVSVASISHTPLPEHQVVDVLEQFRFELISIDSEQACNSGGVCLWSVTGSIPKAHLHDLLTYEDVLLRVVSMEQL